MPVQVRRYVRRVNCLKPVSGVPTTTRELMRHPEEEEKEDEHDDEQGTGKAIPA